MTSNTMDAHSLLVFINQERLMTQTLVLMGLLLIDRLVYSVTANFIHVNHGDWLLKIFTISLQALASFRKLLVISSVATCLFSSLAHRTHARNDGNGVLKQQIYPFWAIFLK